MSKSRTSISGEPNYNMYEEAIKAYRLAGGPVDTANNPVQYFGGRGALACGHIELMDKYIKRVPKYELIMSQDAVMEKSQKNRLCYRPSRPSS